MSIISNSTASAIKDAASSLMSGNLVAFPTETVYGLGADATNEDAVARIYSVKGRPTGHPLIVHISSIDHLGKWAKDVPEYALKLARSFWPGPMTLILPRTYLAKDVITGGQDNVGIRVPSHFIALVLLREFEAQGGLGVAAPSANRFGKVSPTSAQDVEVELGRYLFHDDKILDGGFSNIGIESTIIDCTNSNPVVLRPGAITNYMISMVIRNESELNPLGNLNKPIKAPGLLPSHYSPNARVLLNVTPQVGYGLIAYRKILTPKGVTRLASPANNEEFARHLYRALRTADFMSIKNVSIFTPQGDDIAVAINDRLMRICN
jgi:L-threonylcarbamoyladenylate synthase